MMRLLLILSLLCALVFGALMWSGSGSEGRADFTFVNRGDIGTLDPNRMSWLADIRLGYALWEGLYTLDPKTLHPIPGAADRIEIAPDQTSYTFHLRPEARWSNGDLVTSRDFVFAWRRMLQEPGDYTYLFHDIRGAQAYQDAYAQGKHPDFGSVGIRSLDEHTLKVDLIHPVIYFPDLCAFAPFWPLHEASMEPFYNPASHSYERTFTRPPNLVTNGPFRLASWSFKRKLRLEANPFYWDKTHVNLRTIDMVTADDPMWAYLKYNSGAADWLADASGSIGAELYQQKRPDLHTCTAFGTYFYTLNCQPRLSSGAPNPLADVRVRLALSQSIDRTPIVQQITRMGEPIAYHYIPPGVFPTYPSPVAPMFDVARARELLAQAGYPGGKGFPTLTILFNGEFQHSEVAQNIRRQWLENLGINVSLETVEVKVFRQRLHNKDYTIARASWYGDYNDPSTFTDKYRSNSENNDSAWQVPAYDHLLDQAAVETNPGRRMELFSQAEQLLLEQQPIIPLYHYVNASLYRDNVNGLYMNPRSMVLFKNVSVEH